MRHRTRLALVATLVTVGIASSVTHAQLDPNDSANKPAEIEPLAAGSTTRVARPGRPPLVLRPSGAFIELPLTGYHEVRGRDRRVAFSRGYLWLEQEAVLRPTSMEPGAGEAR